MEKNNEKLYYIKGDKERYEECRKVLLDKYSDNVGWINTNGQTFSCPDRYYYVAQGTIRSIDTNPSQTTNPHIFQLLKDYGTELKLEPKKKTYKQVEKYQPILYKPDGTKFTQSDFYDTPSEAVARYTNACGYKRVELFLEEE